MLNFDLDSLTGGLRPYLILSMLCLIFFGFGLASVPPLDRDESRFIQATRQMMESGDYVRIQFQEQMRAKKPAGAYWMQAASVKLFSDPLSHSLWPYRLPGALAAWAAVLMTFGFGQSLVGRRAALLASIMLASASILVSEAHQAKTDAILLACAVAAQGVLGRFYVAGRAKQLKAKDCPPMPRTGPASHSSAALDDPGVFQALLFWLAQGAAILVKGPIVPVISILTVLALGLADRSFRWFASMRPLPGALITAAVAAPWFLAISHATGGAFIGAAVKGDLLPKLLSVQESHGGPPGYYIMLGIATFWPASLLIWPAMAKVWAERQRSPFRFLLAWALPGWLMFELIPTKLPHYVLPLYPALSLMAAALMCEGARLLRHWAARVFCGIWTLVGLCFALAVVILPMVFGSGPNLPLLLAAIAIALTTIILASVAIHGRVGRTVLALILASCATYPMIFSGVLPNLEKLWVSRSVTRLVDSLGVREPIAAAGFDEPSLVVLLGTRTLLTNGGGAAKYLALHPATVAVVSDTEQAKFLSTASSKGFEPRTLGEIQGFNYSCGKPVALTIYGRRPS